MMMMMMMMVVVVVVVVVVMMMMMMMMMMTAGATSGVRTDTLRRCRETPLLLESAVAPHTIDGQHAGRQMAMDRTGVVGADLG